MVIDRVQPVLHDLRQASGSHNVPMNVGGPGVNSKHLNASK